MDVALFVGRERVIPSIANDVDDKSVGNRFLDAVQVQDVLRGALRPALYTLLACHFPHDGTQKIPAILDIRHHLLANLLSVQSREGIQAGVVPGFQQLPFGRGTAQVTKTRFQQVDDIRFRAIDGKISCRQDHVIKQGCPGTAAAYYKHRSFAAPAGWSCTALVPCQFGSPHGLLEHTRQGTKLAESWCTYAAGFIFRPGFAILCPRCESLPPYIRAQPHFVSFSIPENSDSTIQKPAGATASLSDRVFR